MPAAPTCVLVIFGASGDLAGRKLIPALYDLAAEKLLSERTCIVGYSRSAITQEKFRADCWEAVQRHARRRPVDEDLWRTLAQRIDYIQGDYDSANDYARAARLLADLDQRHGTAGNRLFYLATPPGAFGPIIRRLSELRPAGQQGFARLVVEKPFGSDLASARALNALLHGRFAEEQIFRIDHYLGKETVQNLLVLRFANSIFEPVWNYKYIDHIQITVAETLGVGDRGGYYDQSGALRDMVQNHMFQLMSLVAMEPPVALDARSIHDEKIKVYRSLRPIAPATVHHVTVRGQYGPGEAHGQRTGGYRREKGVAPDSMTETFAAVKLLVDNWRWSGTPFYLRTGKFLATKLSEVVVRFRSAPLTLFQKQCDSPVYPNDLIIRVQPDEGISMRLNGKVPGGQMQIKNVAMDFLYKTAFGAEAPDAYERLIHDAMLGDQTLFISGEEAEAAWSVIDTIEKAWSMTVWPPQEYAPGSWGPKRAMDLIELDGRRWLHSGQEAEPIIVCSL